MSTIPAGSRFGFRNATGQPHGEPWRALDAAIARWVLAHGGSRLLAEVAGWASYAEGQGDSALPLLADMPSRHGFRILSVDEIKTLAAEKMVTVLPGGGVPDTPFVLEFNHFYLRRNAMHESAIAEALRKRRGRFDAPLAPCDDDDLHALFDAAESDAVAQQACAVKQILGCRLFILTGGPGTGKTTTVLRMLMALTREHHAKYAHMPVIRLAAPTGKAARRLADALREGSDAMHKQLEVRESSWLRWLSPAQQAVAMTLHRLLGSRGRQGGFKYDSGNPIDADVVLVDEASMLDLPLLRALLDALSETAVLVLVGDAEQLPPVGAGSVFRDLVAALETAPGDDIIRLRHSFRADQALLPVNEALRKGDPAAFSTASTAAGASMHCTPCATPSQLQSCLQKWQKKLRNDWLDAGVFAVVKPEEVSARLAALGKRQLLCALREGPFGAVQVNESLESLFREEAGDVASGIWYPGRAVMITRNDDASGLYNGDIGLCLRNSEGGLQVWFEAASGADANQGPRCFETTALPSHEGAFAITVHKSQGSEYAEVAVLLPPDADNAVLSRQLLYTAATRARQALQMWCSDAVLEAALNADDVRSSNLQERLES